LNLTLHQQPTLTLQSTSDVICEGTNLEIEALVTNGATYQWIGPDGFTSTSKDVIIQDASQNNNGLYTLTVSSAEGCTVSEDIQISNIASSATPTLFAEDTCIIWKVIGVLLLLIQMVVPQCQTQQH